MAFILVFLAAPAMAQEDEGPIDCTISGTEITNMREPQFSGPNVWDMIEGDDGMEAYADFIPLESGNFIAAGSYTKDKKDNIYHPLIVRFDERFKKVWETKADSAAYKTIHRILKTKSGYTVLGDVQDKGRGNGFYIGFYDDKGKAKGENAFFEKGGSLDAKSLVLAADGTGYVIAAQFTDGKDDQKQYGLVYKISSTGKQIWKRSYQPGPTTVFQTLQPTLNGAYVVAGQIVTEEHKSAGWAMRIDDNGSIGWQRTYPRGLAASLYGGTAYTDGGFLLTGKIRPLTGAGPAMAAWIMKVDATGAPVWQRYFKSPFYDYTASDTIAYEDGRSTVLINGASLDKDHRSHARLMTLSPSGIMLNLEDYSEGQNARANRLVSGLAAERVMAGYAQTSFGETQEGDDPAPAYTYDGWVVSVPALEPYEDPCHIPPPPSPILQ